MILDYSCWVIEISFLLIDAVKNAGKKTYLFSYIDKVSKELIQTFDFRYGFNKEIMERWHIKKES